MNTIFEADEVCAISLQPIEPGVVAWRCPFCNCTVHTPVMKSYALRAMMANEEAVSTSEVYCPLRCGYVLDDDVLGQLGCAATLSRPRKKNDPYASLLRGERRCSAQGCGGYCVPVNSRLGGGASTRRSRCIKCMIDVCLRCGDEYSDAHALLGCRGGIRAAAAVASCAGASFFLVGASAADDDAAEPRWSDDRSDDADSDRAGSDDSSDFFEAP